MKIKTFKAPTMHEAIRAIKAELGPDAVILSTKQVRGSGPLGGWFGRQMVEVAAAADLAARPGPSARELPPTRPQPLRFQDALRSSLARTGPEDVDESGRRCSPSSVSADRSERRRDRSRRGPRAGLTDPATQLVSQLVQMGLQPTTARSLVAEAALRPSDSDSEARRAVHEVLRRRIRVSGPLLKREARKKTVMMIGPAGVGKTTTLAKLATHYRVKEQRKVAIITLDTHRVAAVEQLRMYAGILSVPLEVALSKQEAVDGLRRHRQADLILIDTPGRSPLDAASLEELREWTVLDHPLDVQVVCAAATRHEDLIESVARYAGMGVSGLLFTKLDETTRHGELFELMDRSGLPLSYVGVGQRMVEDLTVATSRWVADLLLGAGLHERDEPDDDESRGSLAADDGTDDDEAWIRQEACRLHEGESEWHRQ